MESLTLYALLIAFMFVGGRGESMSSSCTYVNGVQRCTEQKSQGNVAMSSSQAGYGQGQSYSSNYAATGDSGTGQGSYTSMRSGNPPPFPGNGPFAGAATGPAAAGFDPFAFVFGRR